MSQAGRPPPQRIASRDNPLVKRIRALARDPGAYRAAGQVWLEGEHLCQALLARGGRPAQLVVAERRFGDPADQPWLGPLLAAAGKVAVLPDALFESASGLQSPAGVGALIPLPPAAAIQADAPSVVLDRLQDAGNVGSILRSAAALGVRQVLALKGSAALWSPKVLRAGQGAHFGLALHEGLEAADLDLLRVPMLGTALQADTLLPQARLPWPCAWVLGHEGQGVDPALLARCAATVRIPQPGGEESLNVAAAAAVCLYESLRQRSG